MNLITRSDFDGLISGAILNACGIIDSWKFVHPKDAQDGIVSASSNDILVNIPYIPGRAMWFDHHKEQIELYKGLAIPGERRVESTCSRMIFDYYMGSVRLPHLAPIIDICEKVFKGDLTADEILNPDDRLFLAFLIDPRTGLGRFHHFRISNLALMGEILVALKEKSLEQIIKLPDVAERRKLFFSKKDEFLDFLRRKTRTFENVAFTDLRGCEEIPPGNRFAIYAAFPRQNVSVWVVDGKKKQNVSIALGKSVINRTCSCKMNEICKKFGGGGNDTAATCQVPYEKADKILKEMLQMMKT